MKLHKSQRQKAKIKIAIQGPSGSGKTYSSLLLAKGLANGDLSKVVVIDTENGSSNLYSHQGNYNVLTMKSPYSPERYITAIDTCLDAKMEVIIIDSISHCWDYLLDFHSSLQGNSFTNWAKVNPRQKAFLEKILQSPAHIIATMRTKQDYVLNLKDGKYVPEKVGLKAIQRDGVEYEFTIVFNVDAEHNTKASKDRTNLFVSAPEFKISEATGSKILEWCDAPTDTSELEKQISKAKNINELSKLYHQYPEYQIILNEKFTQRKRELLSNPSKFNQNGTSTDQ